MEKETEKNLHKQNQGTELQWSNVAVSLMHMKL